MLPRFAPTAASSGGWRWLSGFQYEEFPTLRPAKPSGTHKPCCAKNGAPGVKEIEGESPPSKTEDGAPKFFLRLTSGPPVPKKNVRYTLTVTVGSLSMRRSCQ